MSIQQRIVLCVFIFFFVYEMSRELLLNLSLLVNPVNSSKLLNSIIPVSNVIDVDVVRTLLCANF